MIFQQTRKNYLTSMPNVNEMQPVSFSLNQTSNFTIKKKSMQTTIMPSEQFSRNFLDTTQSRTRNRFSSMMTNYETSYPQRSSYKMLIQDKEDKPEPKSALGHISMPSISNRTK